MKRDRTGKSYIRPSIIGAVIFAVLFSHFAVSQFISFQSEQDSLISEAISTLPVEIKTESAAKKSEPLTMPKQAPRVSPVPEPESESDEIAPRQAVMKERVIKKKEAPRESESERLRRAEKLLTGV